MSGCKMDWQKRRKIKNLLTRKVPNLPWRKLGTKERTSPKPLK